MNPGLRIAIRWIAGLIDWLSLAIMGAVGFALDMDASESAMGVHLKWVQENGPELVVGFGASLAASRFIRWLVRDKPAESALLDRIVSNELDSFREKCFEGVANEPKDHNRVTVFKRVHWRWRLNYWRSLLWPWGWGRYPGSGWLKVVQRSGHATQHSDTVFLAPDDAPNAEGVAGHAWRINGAVRVSGLPNLNAITYTGLWKVSRIRLISLIQRKQLSEVDADYVEAADLVRRYAQAAGVQERWLWKRIKQGKRHPISIVAIPLESADNERWGSLVLDSSNHIECIDTDAPVFRRALSSLERCIQQCGLTR